MGRNRDFIETDVLNAVADVFSAHGYNGTSIQMLTEASGLGKQSLYNTFGDKRALYLKSVDCTANRYADIAANMQLAPTGREAISYFFTHLIGHCVSSEASKHTCIVSAGLIEAIKDEEISELLSAKWTATHALLKKELLRGQLDLSIANLAPAKEIADFLISLMSGLRVSARATQDAKRLKSIVQSAFKILDMA
jgi:TetR/AcrR family transcriptional regulator, transcriptional repressor for nem operon